LRVAYCPHLSNETWNSPQTAAAVRPSRREREREGGRERERLTDYKVAYEVLRESDDTGYATENIRTS